jgi:hypothetical protein
LEAARLLELDDATKLATAAFVGIFFRRQSDPVVARTFVQHAPVNQQAARQGCRKDRPYGILSRGLKSLMQTVRCPLAPGTGGCRQPAIGPDTCMGLRI